MTEVLDQQTSPEIDGLVVGRCNTCDVGRRICQLYSDERHVPIDRAMVVVNEKCKDAQARVDEIESTTGPGLSEAVLGCPLGVWGGYTWSNPNA
jgi:hypothetical protein